MTPAAGNPRLRGITFDVGGTLIAPHPSVGYWYAREAQRLGAPGGLEAELGRRFAGVWRDAHSEPGGFAHTRAAWRALAGRVFADIVAEDRLDKLFEALWSRFAGPDAWRLLPGAEEALEAARAAGLKVGVISNWDERLEPLLERLGLARRFDFIVASGLLGRHKPEPDIFHFAARGLGLPADALAHVGDSFAMDVIGALNAGWRAVWVHQTGVSAPGVAAVSGLPGAAAWISETVR